MSGPLYEYVYTCVWAAASERLCAGGGPPLLPEPKVTVKCHVCDY